MLFAILEGGLVSIFQEKSFVILKWPLSYKTKIIECHMTVRTWVVWHKLAPEQCLGVELHSQSSIRQQCHTGGVKNTCNNNNK